MPSGQDHRLGQRFQDLARHCAGLVFGGQPFGQHGELIAAEARDHVDLAHTGGQALCHCAQNLIAGVVAEAVIDVLEAVEVEEQDRQHLAAALGALQCLVELLAEQAAVRQFGEFVVVGKEARALFLLFAFSDVLQHADHPARGTVFVANHVAAGKHVHDLLFVAQQPELVAPLVRSGLYDTEKQLLHACAVVRMDVLEPGRHVFPGLIRGAAEHRCIVVAAPELVGAQIPVEKGVVGRLCCEAKTFQVAPHCLVRVLAARDVPGDNDAHLLAGKLHAEGDHLGVNGHPVLALMAPGADFARSRPKAHQRFSQALRILRRAKVEKR